MVIEILSLVCGLRYIGKFCLLFRSFVARLTNDKLAILGELVVGDLEVQRGRSFPDTARDIVVRTVARAEPATEVTGLADGNATQMGADAYCHDKSIVSLPITSSPSPVSCVLRNPTTSIQPCCCGCCCRRCLLLYRRSEKERVFWRQWTYQA